MTHIGEIISGIILIALALIELRATVARKAEKEDIARLERRAELHVKESRLAMDKLGAAADLAVSNARALQAAGIADGRVIEALEAAEKARKAYKGFLRDSMAEQIERGV